MNKSYKDRELFALYEISKVLNSSFSIKNNINRVLKILAQFLDMERATVYLKENEEISILAAYGMTEEEIKRGRYKIGEGIIGKVAKTGLSIVIPNIGDEPSFLNKTGARTNLDKQNIAFISVPIFFKNTLLGVLSIDKVFRDISISFQEDLRFLKIITNLLSQNINLLKEFEKEKETLKTENILLKKELKNRYTLNNIIGYSDKMQDVFETVHLVANSNATVFLRGESGTGKELIAKALHYMSSRSNKPFIKVNCAAIPENLLESELFGHEKGAFTGAIATKKGKFQLADGGTLFLDEMGDLPLQLQPKLLRVLQEKEFERVGGEKTIKVDIRIIAATSRNIEQLLSENKFREDLYYRLNVIPIFLPPLRERVEDIPLLVEFFLNKFNKEYSKNVEIPSHIMDIFLRYEWKGNIRELENIIERLVITSKNDKIDIDVLPSSIKTKINAVTIATEIDKPLEKIVEEIEKQKISIALQENKNNKSKAARSLGLSLRQFDYKMKKYKI